eukprot:CAMPEP_0177625336 /NCGR_PEP_ID=MMETSP0419_2-20121207/30040_2 /TAXON_ID=582737 /ORGANISM="Tetraselmis sp., Strain GSL018" /LENGTH=507 /DNA_ID=CAMNT_0019126265 /DNA_START=12 /DNA_END=1532 /DNA_ORIENTATION=-
MLMASAGAAARNAVMRAEADVVQQRLQLRHEVDEDDLQYAVRKLHHVRRGLKYIVDVVDGIEIPCPANDADKARLCSIQKYVLETVRHLRILEGCLHLKLEPIIPGEPPRAGQRSEAAACPAPLELGRVSRKPHASWPEDVPEPKQQPCNGVGGGHVMEPLRYEEVDSPARDEGQHLLHHHRHLPPDEAVCLQLKDGISKVVQRPADPDALVLEGAVECTRCRGLEDPPLCSRPSSQSSSSLCSSTGPVVSTPEAAPPGSSAPCGECSLGALPPFPSLISSPSDVLLSRCGAWLPEEERLALGGGTAVETGPKCSRRAPCRGACSGLPHARHGGLAGGVGDCVGGLRPGTGRGAGELPLVNQLPIGRGPRVGPWPPPGALHPRLDVVPRVVKVTAHDVEERRVVVEGIGRAPRVQEVEHLIAPTELRVRGDALEVEVQLLPPLLHKRPAVGVEEIPLGREGAGKAVHPAEPPVELLKVAEAPKNRPLPGVVIHTYVEHDILAAPPLV